MKQKTAALRVIVRGDEYRAGAVARPARSKRSATRIAASWSDPLRGPMFQPPRMAIPYARSTASGHQSEVPSAIETAAMAHTNNWIGSRIEIVARSAEGLLRDRVSHAAQAPRQPFGGQTLVARAHAPVCRHLRQFAQQIDAVRRVARHRQMGHSIELCDTLREGVEAPWNATSLPGGYDRHRDTAICGTGAGDFHRRPIQSSEDRQGGRRRRFRLCVRGRRRPAVVHSEAWSGGRGPHHGVRLGFAGAGRRDPQGQRARRGGRSQVASRFRQQQTRGDVGYQNAGNHQDH